MGYENEKEGVHEMIKYCEWTGDICSLPYGETCPCYEDECPYRMSKKERSIVDFKNHFREASREELLESLYQTHLQIVELKRQLKDKDERIKIQDEQLTEYSWRTNPDGMGK